jgi:hypothetical protein
VKIHGAHDWPAVRHDYVVMGLSRADAMQKHEVSAEGFDYHAKRGEWDRLKTEVAERSAAALKELPRVSDELLVAVDAQWRQRYRELEQMAIYIQRFMAAHGDQMTSHEINRLTQAERNIVQMQRLLMGESTENVGLVDQAVEKVLGLIEKYVPVQDRERFNDDVARIIGVAAPTGLLPAPR